MLSEKAGGDMHPPRLQDLNITQLPAALANLTALEVFEIRGGNVIIGGTLPTEYSAWQSLATFRCCDPCRCVCCRLGSRIGVRMIAWPMPCQVPPLQLPTRSNVLSKVSAGHATHRALHH